MISSGGTAGARQKAAGAFSSALDQASLEHYLRMVIHRKWLVLGVFALVSAATMIYASRMPDVYTSETLILVDPQKVPESYVKPTVTGDVRNRLGTLSQQILSATRLQKIIERLNLYPEKREQLAREEVIGRMRKDINVSTRSDFGATQDLQAFRISYSGKEPRLVAQVTNELASLFIEENLKSREQQATGTTEFLQNQLNETRKVLESQEAQIKDFKLKHVGEMPEHLNSTIQILGQLQNQYQLESEALGRLEQQKSYVQSMMSQSIPGVVEIDDDNPKPPPAVVNEKAAAAAPANTPRTALAALLARGYTEQHPDVRRLRALISEEDAKEKPEASSPAPIAVEPAPVQPAPVAPPPVRRSPSVPANFSNPILTSQLRTIEAEIVKRKQEHDRLAKAVAGYRAKLEAIPIREQQITQVLRDYEITKAHYKQLLEKNLSAEQATQLEIRQKGEKFTVLDPGQVPEKPSSPNRPLINMAGSLGGLALGLALAVITEFRGISITEPQQIASVSGLVVLEVIPIIRTNADRRRWKTKSLWAAVSGVIVMLAIGAFLLYRYGIQVF